MSYRRDPEFSSGPGAIASVDGVSNVRRRIAKARAKNTKIREQRMARVRMAMGAMPASTGTRPTYTLPSNPIGPPPRSVTIRGSIRGALVPMGPRLLPPPPMPGAGGMTGPGPVAYPGTGVPTAPPVVPGAPAPLPTPTPIVPTTPATDGSSGGGGGGAGIVSGAPSSAAPPNASTPDDGSSSDLPDVPAPASSPSFTDTLKEHWLLIALGVGAFALWRSHRD